MGGRHAIGTEFRGLPSMTSANISEFYLLSPVRELKQPPSYMFLPPLLSADVINGGHLTRRCVGRMHPCLPLAGRKSGGRTTYHVF